MHRLPFRLPSRCCRPSRFALRLPSPVVERSCVNASGLQRKARGHPAPRVAPSGHPRGDRVTSTPWYPQLLRRSTRTTHVRAHRAGRLRVSDFRTCRMRGGPSSRRSRNQVQPFKSPPFLTGPPPNREPARGAIAQRTPPPPPPGKSVDSQPIQLPAQTLGKGTTRGAADAAPFELDR